MSQDQLSKKYCHTQFATVKLWSDLIARMFTVFSETECWGGNVFQHNAKYMELLHVCSFIYIHEKT